MDCGKKTSFNSRFWSTSAIIRKETRMVNAHCNRVVGKFLNKMDKDNLVFDENQIISIGVQSQGALTNSESLFYKDYCFKGISLEISPGESQELTWSIICDKEACKKRFKVYVNRDDTWYIYELQTWGAGKWQGDISTNHLNFPHSSLPKEIAFGKPVGIFGEYEDNEKNVEPKVKPPKHNPFEPLVEISKEAMCWDQGHKMKVSIIQPEGVEIHQALVFKNNLFYKVSLSELLKGAVFKESGDYEIDVYYSHSNCFTESIKRYFTVTANPYTMLQVDRVKCANVEQGQPVIFYEGGTENGSIQFDATTGDIIIHFLGVYLIKWLVVTKNSDCSRGCGFAIVGGKGGDIKGSTTVKEGCISGYTVVEVNSLPYKIRLVNTGSKPINICQGVKENCNLCIMKIGNICNCN